MPGPMELCFAVWRLGRRFIFHVKDDSVLGRVAPYENGGVYFQTQFVSQIGYPYSVRDVAGSGSERCMESIILRYNYADDGTKRKGADPFSAPNKRDGTKWRRNCYRQQW